MNVATPFVFFFHFYSPSLFLHIPLFYCLANLNIFFLFVVATTLTVHVNKSIPAILMFILFSFFFSSQLHLLILRKVSIGKEIFLNHGFQQQNTTRKHQQKALTLVFVIIFSEENLQSFGYSLTITFYYFKLIKGGRR